MLNISLVSASTCGQAWGLNGYRLWNIKRA